MTCFVHRRLQVYQKAYEMRQAQFVTAILYGELLLMRSVCVTFGQKFSLGFIRLQHIYLHGSEMGHIYVSLYRYIYSMPTPRCIFYQKSLVPYPI